MVHGRDKIAAFYGQSVQQLGDAKVTTTDVLKLGRNALREIGTVTLKTKGDQPQEMTGKYAAVWRKVDGQWMLETDIWNMNK
jgi:ketosteroid isomerase-like protein